MTQKERKPYVRTKPCRPWSKKMIDAHRMIRDAIKIGIVDSKDNCEMCGIKEGTYSQKLKRLDTHHMDYNKPLEVIFLCRKCHGQMHKEHGQGLNVEGDYQRGDYRIRDYIAKHFPDHPILKSNLYRYR